MSKIKRILAPILLIFIISCQNDSEIIRLLNSKEKDDVIKGAYLAGENGNVKYATFLLKDANDVRTSTNIKFKGYNVYQEKMIALSKIYKKKPPKEITSIPDSTVINFYLEIVQK